MARVLNEKQQKFLDVLFAEAGGDYNKAKEMAGYSDSTSAYQVMSALREEIGDKLREALGTTASVKAYKSLIDVLNQTDDPLGRKERIQVSRDLLDRAGHKATDKVEVSGTNNLFILPPKSDADTN